MESPIKLAAVRRLEAGVSLAEVARGLEVNPNVLHRWRREFRQAPGNAFPGNGQPRWSDGRLAELERKIGQQVLEIDFDDFDSGAPWRPEISDKRSKNALASASSPRTLKHFRILVIHK